MVVWGLKPPLFEVKKCKKKKKKKKSEGEEERGIKEERDGKTTKFCLQ